MSKQKGAFEKFVDGWRRRVLADREIGANAKVVAMAISLHFNRENFLQNKGDLAFPGIATLAAMTGLHRSTVIRANSDLEGRHLEVRRRRIGKRNMANRYIPLSAAAPNSQGSQRGLQRRSASSGGANVHHLVAPVRLPSSSGATLTSDLTSDLTPDTINIASLRDVAQNNSAASEGSKKGDSRESKEVAIESPPSSIKAECYRIAREGWGERGASLVGQAFQCGRGDSEVTEILCESRDAGVGADELAAALWVPDFKPYRGYGR